MKENKTKNNRAMKKVLAIGGATLDTIIKYEEMETLVHQKNNFEEAYLLLAEGRKIEVTEQQSFSGGGATNAAVALSKLGLEADLFCKIGQDPAGDFILKELNSYGLKPNYICRVGHIGTASSFVVPSLSGDRTIFAYRGANSTLLAEELPEKAILDADFLYITSLSKASAAHLPEIVKLAKTHGTLVAINPGSSQLKRGSGFLKESLFGIEILILNYEEAQLLMSSLLQEEQSDLEKNSDNPEKKENQPAHEQLLNQTQSAFSLIEFFKKVQKEGPKVVVVTNGSKGVYVCEGQTLLFHHALKVMVVNTLGAGDAFGSSFVGAYLTGSSLQESIRFGVLNSASVVGYPDAKTGLLSREDIQKRLITLDDHLLETLPNLE